MKRYVLVTTEYRGVFFGRLEREPDYEQDARRIILHGVRNVIRWTGERGFLGLATHGPEKGSRIGATAEEVQLHGINLVADCSDVAIKAFVAWGSS